MAPRHLGLLILGLVLASGSMGLFAARPAAALTPHAPISIWFDWAFPGASGVTGGNGTRGNPYIIEGWDINASNANGIKLDTTTAYVVIRNVSIHNAVYPYVGIYLLQAQHVRIENVTLTNNEVGLTVYGGSANRMANSTVVNDRIGVRFAYTADAELNASSIYGSTNWGVQLDHSTRANVTYTDISGSGLAGISTTSDTGSRLIGNRIHDNFQGIQLGTARNALLGNNTFTNEGVTLTGSTVLDFASHTMTPDNRVNGKPLLYYRNSVGTSISGVPVGELILANCTNARVNNLTIAGSDIDVGVYFATGGWINDSTITQAVRYGLDVEYGTGLHLNRNTLDQNADTGMYMNYHTGAVIQGNSFRSNAYNGLILSYAHGALVEASNFSSNSNYGVESWNTNGFTLLNDQVWNNTDGGYIYGGTGIVVSGGRFSKNSYGLYLTGTVNLTLRDANLSYNTDGAYFYGGSGALLVHNSLFANPGFGLAVTNTPRSTFQDNRVVASMDGLMIYTSGWATAVNNTLVGNTNRGIFVYNSGLSSFTRNNMSRNVYGLELYSTSANTVANNTFYGNTAYGAYLLTAYYTRIHHNAFIGNAIQAFDSWAQYNYWNLTYPGGGNYWSNYTGVDRCSGASQTDCSGPDGFGDSPYSLGYGAFDYQPLIRAPNLPNTPPTGVIAFSPTPVLVAAPVTFDASHSWDYQDPKDSLQVRWDWTNDGTWDTNWTTSKAAPHTFPQAGTFTVKLGVRDSEGLMANATKTVVVVTPLQVTGPQSDRSAGQAPLDVAFTSDVTGGQGPYSYAWDFGDGTTSTEASPTHTYTQAGTYTVTLVATDSQGQVVEKTMTITVQGPTNPPGGPGPLPVSGPLLYGLLAATAALVGTLAILARRRRRRGRGPRGGGPESDAPYPPSVR